MKYLLIAAFISCGCLVSVAQQRIEKTEVASVWQPMRIIDPLYLLSTSGSTKEVTKAEFEKIDMKRVEYIKVLKDAASIDIYGERGKNGVVLIVMKGNGGRIRKR